MYFRLGTLKNEIISKGHLSNTIFIYDFNFIKMPRPSPAAMEPITTVVKCEGIRDLERKAPF